jgi:uncharacterized membrane protein
MNDNPPFPPQGRGFDIGPFYMHHGGPPALAWATFALVLLLMLSFFALLIARTAGRRHGHWHHRVKFAGHMDPLELMRMRYARGEIDRDTFLQGTSDLTVEKPAS